MDYMKPQKLLTYLFVCLLYRTCLRYFLPPQWNMEKDTISQLTVPELTDFPLDDFFDHYEKGLRKVSSYFLRFNS